MTDVCTAYAEGVLLGEIKAGTYVYNACLRHIRDLEHSKEYWFDTDTVTKLDWFASQLIQFEGEFSGRPLSLLPWQAFCFGSIYGWKRRDNGFRRFRTAHIEVPRKCGKTTCAVVPCLWAMLVEGEPGAEIYALATKQDQAKKVWDAAWKIAAKSPLIRPLVRKRFNAIENEKNLSYFRPLGADSNTLDGLNPHLAICDELHAWKDRDLYDVIKDGMGSRTQPLIISITTAGYDQNGVCYELRSHGINVNDPAKTDYEDDSMFCYVAAPRESNLERWDKEDVWYEANPSLGVTKRVDFMRDMCQRAKQIPSEKNTFLNKQLNIWTTSRTAWLDTNLWRQLERPFTLEDMRNEECFLGVDLAKVNDMSSVSYLFPPSGTRTNWRVYVDHFLPEENLKEKGKRTAPYETWAELGWLKTTPGNCTDFDWIRATINDNAKIVHIQEIAFDRHFAHEMVTRLQDDGFECTSFGQGFVSMAAPSSELERLIVTGGIEHNGDKVLTWQIGNVIAVTDPAGNIKPDKSTSKEKIDGVSATIMALGRAMLERVEVSPYESMGIRSV